MRDFHLAIVSDLHLSEGWDPRTGRISRIEDFFFDDVFARFLGWLAQEGVRSGRPWLLIVAGDLVDFLQVTSLPKDERFPLRTSERTHGLGTAPDKTVWKLGVVATGHRRLFRALGRFLAEGNRLAVIAGNHDMEWVMPAVQEAFIRHLAEAGGAFPPEAVSFHPWFYWEQGRIWVEHGQQYDGINAYDYPYYPFLSDGEELLLPAGSFFVRYLFNIVEHRDPFADNIKPVGAYLRRYLGSLICSRRVVRHVIAFARILGKIRRLTASERSRLAGRNDNALAAELERVGLSFQIAREIGRLWEPCGLYNRGFWSNLASFFQPENDKCYRKVAERIVALLSVPLVVCGHTHTADLWKLPSGALYMNSGSWTRVFCADETERLIRDEQSYPFVRVLADKGDRAELMVWRDDLGQGERLKLLEHVRGDGRSKVTGAILQGIAIVLMASALGLAVNAVRPDGLNVFCHDRFERQTNFPGKSAQITLEETVKLYRQGRVMLLDARDAWSYEEGHITGAHRVTPREAAAAAEIVRAALRAGKKVIAYCDGAACPLSEELSKTFRDLGIGPVYVLKDGWRLWNEGGYPVDRRR